MAKRSQVGDLPTWPRSPLTANRLAGGCWDGHARSMWLVVPSRVRQCPRKGRFDVLVVVRDQRLVAGHLFTDASCVALYFSSMRNRLNGDPAPGREPEICRGLCREVHLKMRQCCWADRQGSVGMSYLTSNSVLVYRGGFPMLELSCWKLFRLADPELHCGIGHRRCSENTHTTPAWCRLIAPEGSSFDCPR